ncbi:TPA: phage tail protein [Proteus mirabilis]|nr:phage tail protein [Proteus mirabilis]
MSAKFFALLTVIGANKLAKATALGTTLKITQMAVGDGGGTLPMPSAEQTKLVNEKRRAGINTLFIDSKNANQIVAEQVIPENEGGYWIREIGLFDDEGSLIAVGNCPETYKPQLQEGSGRTQTIRMILTVSHTESVELKVDPSVILATRESVDNAIEIASKSILDTVEKEYATKDEVKKKFDNSNIVHEKGASKEKVISQKGVTELFQPKGNYQPAGNYVTTATFNLEINKKIDKASLSQQLGNDVNKVPSLDLVTKELGGKQPKGNYADKSSSSPQNFTGAIESFGGGVIASSAGKLIALKATDNEITIEHRLSPGNTRKFILQDKSGTAALLSDVESSELVPHPIPWSLPTAPSGYLICQGQTFNKATYPKLAIAYPSGRLPDLRGEFIRGADAGRGVDVGREILSNQLGNSLLSTNLFNIDGEVAKQFEIKIDYIGHTGTNNAGSYGIHQQIEGQNGNETRPRNIAFLYIVRAA